MFVQKQEAEDSVFLIVVESKSKGLGCKVIVLFQLSGGETEVKQSY
jgi:hypothetical protein